MGWLWWRTGDQVEFVGVSPKKGFAFSKAIDTAKEVLVTKNVAVFGQQRDQIVEAEKISKMINNQLFSMKQFSNQVAEWTTAVKKTLDHVTKQSALVEELEGKFSEYQRLLGELQRLSGYDVPEGSVPSRQVEFQKGEKSKLLAQAREAISKINAQLKEIKEEVDAIHQGAGNLLKSKMPEGYRGAGGIPMMNSIPDDIVRNCNSMIQVAENMIRNNVQLGRSYAELIGKLQEASEDLRVQIDASEQNLVRTGP